MKLPAPAPDWRALLEQEPALLVQLLRRQIGPEVAGRYEHWDHLRHLTPPEALEPAQWWAALKLARTTIARTLPLLDRNGQPFTVVLTDSIQRKLFFVARDASGALRGADPVQDGVHREQYLLRSLMEEAMTSSQLEGAATTIQAAKDLLLSNRPPRDYGERMIVNNFATMRELRRWADRPLAPDTVFEIHRMLTDGTLKDADSAGRFRRHDEDIVVEDENGVLLHLPPDAAELPRRMQALCDFANQDDDDTHFIHPVVRAILIHFTIGYDHPFVDGNGRTARALFYWSMLRSGFRLAEYISISSILRKAPGQYTRAYLHTESDEGDTTHFVSHQLDVLLRAIESVHAWIARKQQARREAENLLSPRTELSRQLNHRQRALLLNALRHPGKNFSIGEHQRTHGVVYQTARSDLLGLVDAGLMRQHRQGRAHLFAAVDDLARRLGG